MSWAIDEEKIQIKFALPTHIYTDGPLKSQQDTGVQQFPQFLPQNNK